MIDLTKKSLDQVLLEKNDFSNEIIADNIYKDIDKESFENINPSFHAFFNFEAFLKNAYAIHMRFIPETKYSTKFEQSDKLILNLLEEIYEMDEAYNSDSGRQFEYINEAIKEKVDVINYIGSIISLWLENDENMIDRYFNKIQESINNIESLNIGLRLQNGILLFRKSAYEDLYNSNFQFFENTDVIYKITKNRRNFVERKWHKPFNPADLEGSERDDIILNFIMSLSLCLFKYLGEFGRSNKFYMIQEKQEKILSLPIIK